MVEDPESGEEGGGPVGREDEAAERRREEEQEVPDDAGEAVERGQALRGRAESGERSHVLEAVADLVHDVREVEEQEESGAPEDMTDPESRAEQEHGCQRDTGEGDRRQVDLGQRCQQPQQGHH